MLGKMFQQGDFLIQPGATAKEIAERRRRIEKLRPQFGKAEYIGEGLGHLAFGIGSGFQERALDREQRAGDDEARGVFDRIFSGGLSGQAGPNDFTVNGYATQPQGTSFNPSPSGAPRAPVAENPNDPAVIGDDAMRALGRDPLPRARGSDWLRYTNQSAVRNLPLAPELVNALSFLPEMGIEVEVFSGGQHPEGSGEPHVGSPRHDHGRSADVFFYKDGRRLDWANPADVPIYEEIVRRGRANGLTGFGAGEGYMRPGSMHVGFGNEAVWGANGKGVNAAPWLARVYAEGAAPTPPGQPSPADTRMAQADTQGTTMSARGQQPPAQAGAQAELQQLYQALAHPFMSDEMRAAITHRIQAIEQQADPMRRLDLELKRAQLDAARNPTPKPPEMREDANGVLRFVGGENHGQPVFPNVDAAPETNFEDESKLRKEFTALPAVKAFSEQSQAFGRIVESARNPSPAGDLALIFNYMKVLDPGSVVRESEFATAQSASAWMQEMEAGGGTVPRPVAQAIRTLNEGTLLSPAQRNDFVGTALGLYRSAERNFQSISDQYGTMATDYQLDPERTIPDFGYEQQGSPLYSQRPKSAPGRAPTVAPSPAVAPSQTEAPAPVAEPDMRRAMQGIARSPNFDPEAFQQMPAARRLEIVRRWLEANP